MKNMNDEVFKRDINQNSQLFINGMIHINHPFILEIAAKFGVSPNAIYSKTIRYLEQKNKLSGNFLNLVYMALTIGKIRFRIQF